MKNFLTLIIFFTLFNSANAQIIKQSTEQIEMNIKFKKNLKLKLEKLEITPYKVFNTPKPYYSRSVIGMRPILKKLGLEENEILSVIEIWIEEKKLISTETQDNHFTLGNMCKQ